jgi:hypothetical protein
LTGGSTANSFTVSGWTGTGTINGAGNAVGTNDTIVSTNDTDFTLTSTSLAVSGGGTFTIINLEAANLTGGAGANTFTVSGWAGKGILTGGGGADTVVATKDRNFTLGAGSLATSDGLAMTTSGVGTARLTGGSNNNSFTINDWAGSVVIDGDGSGDTVVVNRDANFVLTDSSVTTSDGLVVSLTSIESAKLTGGASNNSFELSGWTSATQGTITGGGGSDTVNMTRDGNIVLTNTALTVKATVGGAVTTNMILSGIAIANLSGGSGVTDNTYTLTGWTGGGSVDGKLGNDTIVKSDDVNYTLTNTSLATATSVVSPVAINTMTLAGVESAALTGGASNNVFDISGWTHVVALNANSGTGDVLIITKNADITLGASTLSASDGLSGTISAFEKAVLTGGIDDNHIDASAFAGAADLFGMDGNDILIGGSGVNNISGGDGLDLLIGGLGADVLQGGAGGDILIGATTVYGNNYANLNQILAKWTNGASYASRVSDIKNGVGTPPLAAANITEDSAIDSLTGGSDTADANLDFLFEKITGVFADTFDSDVGETPVTF